MAAPSDLTVTSISTSQIDLAWNNNNGYTNIRILRGTASGGSKTLIDTISGSATSYSNTSISTNTRYYYQVFGFPDVDRSNEANAASWSESHTETSTWGDAATMGIVTTATGAETLTWTDFVRTSQSLKTDYGYFYGSSNGKVYEYSSAAQSDAGTNILAYWQSKRLDFSDQYPEAKDHWKAVQKIQLKYVDLTASTPFTVYLSTDGGVTWESSYRTLGTGDGKAKWADFFFITTGDMFSVKVESSSTSKKFQLLGVYIYFTLSGEVFEI